MELKIIYRSVDSIFDYSKNSRIHSDEQIQQIEKSIQHFGFTNPVLIKKSGELIAGHGRMMMNMMSEAGLMVRHVLIWDKISPTFGMGLIDYEYQHEVIFYTWGKRHNFYGNGAHKTSIWKIQRPKKFSEHPTTKPVELVANAILNSSKQGDVIIDFFSGSGTTIVAAHHLNRVCYAMEINPWYCQVAINRMLKFDPSLQVEKLQ